MQTTRHIYTTKAEKYARYRWDYAPEAIQILLALPSFNAGATIADVGAGTGILSRHLSGRARRVIALEPNQEMRIQASRQQAGHPDYLITGAAAEALPLADHCVDLITAGQAVHWFQPGPTKTEFQRVLKADGRLVFIRNHGTDPELQNALGALEIAENGIEPERCLPPGIAIPISYYLAEYETFSLPFVITQDWEEFLGGLLSASYMPDEDAPGYPNLERTARAVFERFSWQGRLEVKGATELSVGKMMKDQANAASSRISLTNPGPA
jgi:SAM-dependent methyltransferase